MYSGLHRHHYLQAMHIGKVLAAMLPTQRVLAAILHTGGVMRASAVIQVIHLAKVILVMVVVRHNPTILMMVGM